MLRAFEVRRALTGIYLTATLAGCGTYTLSAPPASVTSAPRALAHRPRIQSWMNETASGQDLLYVADTYANTVYVYTYPEGHQVGALTGFSSPLGECVDGAGNIFIVTAGNRLPGSSGVIYKYAHGGTSPIATLSDPNFAFGCAVDSRSGDLAVSGGGVAIFKNASGEPVIYESSEYNFYFCGYDGKGTLYLSASNGDYLDEEQLVRLDKGSSTFREIALGVTLYGEEDFPSSVQWDGKRMTVSSASDGIGGRHYAPASVYRLSISGSGATVVGTTTLSSKKNKFRTGQIWIQRKTVVGSDYLHDRGGIDSWSYPTGGKPRRTVRNEVNFSPFGVAVSPAGSQER